MSVLGTHWGALPGLDSAYTTYQAEFAWGGPHNRGLIQGFIIDKDTVDARSTPNTRLQPGLVLGKITTTGQLTHYDDTATDGSQVAVGVLMGSFSTKDPLADATRELFAPVLVGGPVQAAKLGGLDQQARQAMFGRFVFDDDVVGNSCGWRDTVAKTANYTVTAGDNNRIFTTQGATAAVVFTLPTIAKGLRYRFFAESSDANATLTVASAVANTMVTFNDATASSVVLNTANEIVGGSVEVLANANATKWLVFPMLQDTQSLSVT